MKVCYCCTLMEDKNRRQVILTSTYKKNLELIILTKSFYYCLHLVWISALRFIRYFYDHLDRFSQFTPNTILDAPGSSMVKFEFH